MLELRKVRQRAKAVGIGVHDDATREYAYGPAQGLPDTKVGTLSQAMYDMAKKTGLDDHPHEEGLEADLCSRIVVFDEHCEIHDELHMIGRD
jgi:hypothetical protein